MVQTKREGKLQKLAREKGITKFISVFDIVNNVMEEFVEKLEIYKTQGMTEEQFTTAKDIRRMGKNMNAAQNCRKRAREAMKAMDAREAMEAMERKKVSKMYLRSKLSKLQSLPSPTTSFPLDTNGGYYSSNSTDSRRDSHDSRDSWSSTATVGCGGKPRPKREGKDEKLAREKGITKFISVYDIINDVMEEFVEKLEKYKTQGMTEEQFTTAKDIRRRGKNKNAARNCRKRRDEERIDNLSLRLTLSLRTENSS